MRDGVNDIHCVLHSFDWSVGKLIDWFVKIKKIIFSLGCASGKIYVSEREVKISDSFIHSFIRSLILSVE